MKVTITDTEILIEDMEDREGETNPAIDWSCRLASHEACAWAMKHLGEELEKSVAFYRTGKAIDDIVMG